MSDELRRLVNALERAVEDLASARVLVDGALRQIEDRVQVFRLRKVIRATEDDDVGKPACHTPAGNGHASPVGALHRRQRDTTPLHRGAPAVEK